MFQLYHLRVAILCILIRSHPKLLLSLNLFHKFIPVGTILRNGTERNDGLNHGTERFLKLKLATYHC